MKNFMRFAIHSLPMVLGIICSLTALAFLVEFASRASFGNLEDEEYWGFVLFSLVGLPLTLFGINRLSNDAAP